MKNGVRLDLLKISWLAVLGAALMSCVTTEPAPAGEVTLSYDSGSKSRAVLVLENGSSQTLYFRGTKSLERGTNPWDTAIECTSAKTSLWDQEPFGLKDGISEIIKVLPGERVRLSVYGLDPSFAANHKGDLCIFHLELQGHRVIDSKAFRP